MNGTLASTARAVYSKSFMNGTLGENFPSAGIHKKVGEYCYNQQHSPCYNEYLFF